MHTTTNGTANLTVVIRPEPAGVYTAEVVGLPELRATAATPEAALAQTQGLLNEFLAETRWHQVTIPLTTEQPSPPKGFGHAKDDPTFEDYREAIHRFRQQMDDQARRGHAQQT